MVTNSGGDVLFTFNDPDVTYQDTPLPELEVDVAGGVVRVNQATCLVST